MGAERRQYSALTVFGGQGPEVKKRVQVYYKRLYDETVGSRYASIAPRRAPIPPATSASPLRSST
jgi:hypothetical protein